MPDLVTATKHRVRAAARATVFSVMGVIFGLAGLGFLTVALWIVVAAYESALVAYTTIGALYVVLGFCLMALGAQSGREPDPKPGDPPEHGRSGEDKDPIVRMAEGFAVGMQAGRAMRERGD